MAITITIEDGTGVTNANSYVSLATVRNYAADRGKAVPADDDKLAAHVIRAADYLWALRDRFKGWPTYEGQRLPFPRSRVIVGNGETIASDAVPYDIVQAQIEITLALASGIDVLPTRKAGPRSKARTIGPLKFEYENSDDTVKLPMVEAMLAPYLVSALTLRTRRV